MKRLNIGCGRAAMVGYINLDAVKLPGVDVVADLTKPPLPFDDDSIDEIVGNHVIEHMSGPDTLVMMAELWRIARPSAFARFKTPYGSSNDAWEDPTHIRPIFENTYSYFAQPSYWRADYGYRADWQPTEIILNIPRVVDSRIKRGKQPLEPWLAHRIVTERNIVQEMEAVLQCQKPAREPKAQLRVAPNVIIDGV